MKPDQKNGYKKAGVLSELLFFWLNPLINASKTEEIKIEDLNDFPKSFSAEKQCKNLNGYWKRYEGKTNRVAKAVFRCYLSAFVINAAFGLLFVIGTMATPFLLQNIIDYVAKFQSHSAEERLIYGFSLLAALALVKMMCTFLSQNIEMRQQIAGDQAIIGLGSIVYQKILRMSSTTNKKFSQGKIMNMYQLDCARVSRLVNQLALVINTTVSLVLSMYLLFVFLGVVALVGLGICILSLIFNYFLGKWVKSYSVAIMGLKDERIKKSTEILQNIKIIKMYGWSDCFHSLIGDFRAQEIRMMQKASLMVGLLTCGLFFFPKMVGVGTFFIYGTIYDNITLGEVFATISIFRILAFPLMAFPWLISSLIDAVVSSKRIQEFLESEEIPEVYSLENSHSSDAVEINHCSFYWDKLKEDVPEIMEEQFSPQKAPMQTQSELRLNEEDQFQEPQVDYYVLLRLFFFNIFYYSIFFYYFSIINFIFNIILIY